MRRRPDISLLVQAALVVLPVALLSGVALSFLREDKAAIEQDARERAGRVIAELARRVGERAGGVVAKGRTRKPREYARLPEPPDWPGQLTAAQLRMWAGAQRALYQDKDGAAALRMFREFAGSGVAGEARANAEYEVALLEAKGDRARRALEVARRYPDAAAESGAPVADLALLVALRDAGSAAAALAELARRMEAYPSFLTPALLDAAERAEPGVEVQKLRAAWMAQEKTRALLRRLSLLGPEVKEAWLAVDGESFLALRGEGGEVAFAPKAEVEAAFRDAFPAVRSDVPDYAGAAVELAGRRVGFRDSGRARPLELATAAGALASHPFTFRLELAEPELLYAPYRRRQWMTAALVCSAAAAAMIGLVSLWRGFRRQLLLGEMKSNFVSSVSHELRAPIAAVQLMAESLDRGKIADAEKQHQYLGLIAQECRRLSALVENVLDLSRIEKGRKEYHFEPVEPMALVVQVAALMGPFAAERGVRLSLCEPAAAFPQACWDGQAVSQSLVNLLDNAIKHAPAGTEIDVAVEVSGDVVRVSVRDRGPGIPEAEQARIFEMFYRCGSELRRETKGAGIGLSVVKHVAEAHCGRVVVESAVGHGSRFTLELPIARPV